jgi:hypothetical protein
MQNGPVVRVFGTITVCALLTLSAWAQSDSRIVYAGEGTTLNGTPLYSAASVANGDTVSTAGSGAALSISRARIELEPQSRFAAGDPAQMVCGAATVTASGPFNLQVASLSVRTSDGKYKVANDNGAVRVSAISGTLEVTQEGKTATIAGGQSVSAIGPGCSSVVATARELPDAPGAVARDDQDEVGSSRRRLSSRDNAPATAAGPRFSWDSRVADRSYWSVTGALFSSSIVGAELSVRCVEEGKCANRMKDFPTNRALVYGVGIPADAGVAYLTYYLKKKRSHFWFVPAAAITAGNIYFAAHSAHWLGK